MSLSNDLIQEFAKLTTVKEKKTEETTIYGTAVEYEGRMYARIDGSDRLTPVTTTVDVKPGERVTITIKNHSATVTGNVTSPSARTDDVKDLGGKVDEFNIVLAKKVDTEQLTAQVARIDQLTTDTLSVKETLTANTAEINTLKAKDVEIDGKLTANEASIENLETTKLDVDIANARYATIENLNATNANVYNLDASYGNIHNLIFGTATGDVIQTSFANAVIAQLGDAQIKSAMIDEVNANKIKAGDIVTSNVRVVSEDGKLLISDNTIQISDDGNQVRVQIGKDASGDYSINIWDAEGNLMFSEGGITDKAIKDAIIRNDMVSSDANIDASKLNISSLFREINDNGEETIKATKVYLDDKEQTLEVSFKEMSDEVASQGTKITAVQGQIATKIWQQDIDDATDEMSTQYSALEQNVNSFKTTVSQTYASRGMVTALTERVSTSESEIEQLDDKITANVSTTDGLSKRMSTVEQTAGSLTSRVTSVENMEIGGRNLLLNTGSSGKLIMYRGVTEPVMRSVNSWNNNAGHLTLNCSTTGEEVYYRFISPNTGSLYDLEPGKSYTLSGKAKVSTNSGTLERLIVRTQHYTINTGWTGGVSHVITDTNTDDWISFTSTFTIPEGSTAYYTSLQLYYTGSWNGVIELKELKMESGVKATDWTAAPEDLESRVSSAESIITQLDDKIVANVKDTDALGTRMSTVEQTASGLTVRLDNQRIGGVNILSNTKDNPKGSATRSSIVSNAHMGFNAAHYDNRNATGTVEVSTFWSCITPEPNTEYTLSFYAKGSGTISSFFYPDVVASGKSSEGVTTTSGDGLIQHALTADWKRYSITWKTKSDVSGVKNVLPMRAMGNADCYICGIKFEKGNVATDWSPSPEEVKSGIENASKSATDYINASEEGLIVGDQTGTGLGENVLIANDSVNVRNGDTTNATFAADRIELAKNNDKARIDILNGRFEIIYSADSSEPGLGIYGSSAAAGVTRRLAMQPVNENGNLVIGYGGYEAKANQTNIYGNVVWLKSAENVILSPDSSWTESRGNITMTNGKALYGKNTDGINRSLVQMNASNQYIFGYGGYSNSEGSSYYYGNTINIKSKAGTYIEGIQYGKQKVLASGAQYMTASQTWSLNEKISDQANGIVLVFSAYTNDTVQDYWWSHHFVPKAWVAEHGGSGSSFILGGDNTFSYIGGKYLYISDTSIKGHNNNTSSGYIGEGATGVTWTGYRNDKFVLRYVYGV